jgi:N-acetylneuraminic acid mutarotase
MRYRLLLPSLLTLSALGLAACGDETTTEPTSTSQTPALVPELALTSNSWVTRTDLWSSQQTDFTTATVENASGKSVVYAIGGRSATGSRLSKVMAYDVATNTWSVKAPLPVPLYGMNQAAVLGGKIYVSGGCSFARCLRDAPSSSLVVYNPATNAWSWKAEMPSIRDTFGFDLYSGMNGSTGVIGGQLYTLSSCYYGDAPYFENCWRPLFYRYNPATDRWTTLPRPPATATERYGGVIAGKFYAMGDYVHVYDPATNRWTRKARLPSSLPYSAAATVMLSRIYIVGGALRLNGTVLEAPLRTTMSYDPATDTWTRRADLPSARYGIAASKIFVNGLPRLEVVGGARPGNNLQYIP